MIQPDHCVLYAIGTSRSKSPAVKRRRRQTKDAMQRRSVGAIGALDGIPAPIRISGMVASLSSREPCCPWVRWIIFSGRKAWSGSVTGNGSGPPGTSRLYAVPASRNSSVDNQLPFNSEPDYITNLSSIERSVCDKRPGSGRDRQKRPPSPETAATGEIRLPVPGCFSFQRRRWRGLRSDHGPG